MSPIPTAFWRVEGERADARRMSECRVLDISLEYGAEYAVERVVLSTQ